jgi:hypothetical protein
LIDKDIFRPKYWDDLSSLQKKKVIISFTFLKEKKDLEGNLAKLKARLVAGGHMVEAEYLGDISSPTAKTDSVLLLFALAARKSWKLSCKDIAGAYLNTKLKPGDEHYMRLGPEETAAVIAERPEWKPFVRKDGTMIVELIGGLYGLPQAARLWYEMLKASLEKLGYKKSKVDDCMFIKFNERDDISVILIHVDDIMHVFSKQYFDDELNDALSKEYGKLTLQDGDQGIYVGIEYRFDRANKAVNLSMHKYIRQLLTDYNVSKTSDAPCTMNLMDHSDGDNTPCSPKKFMSLVMALYFVAARVRPDILFVVNHLSTRSQSCTNKDYADAFRVLKYLNKTKESNLYIKPGGTRLHFYVDASFNIHADGRSHSGFVFSLGGDKPSLGLDGAVSCGTSVQRFITVSSTEAEMAAVFYLHQLFEFYTIVMDELKVSSGKPILVMQDNQAAIINYEKGFKGRTKPVNLRYHYIRELVEEGKIQLVKVDTKDMIADPLTKPFYSKPDHIRLLQRLLNDPVVLKLLNLYR